MIKVKIFGIPIGFEVFPEEKNDNDYEVLKNFYDNSQKEDFRFVVRQNGAITRYSFMKFNLLGSGGRANSLLGISFICEGVYLDNPLKLLEDCKKIYSAYLDNQIIVKNQYKIKSFRDEPSMKTIVIQLEEFIRKQYTVHIKKLDTVRNATQEVRKNPENVSDLELTDFFRKYGAFTLSPSAKKEDESVEIIEEQDLSFLRDLTVNSKYDVVVSKLNLLESDYNLYYDQKVVLGGDNQGNLNKANSKLLSSINSYDVFLGKVHFIIGKYASKKLSSEERNEIQGLTRFMSEGLYTEKLETVKQKYSKFQSEEGKEPPTPDEKPSEILKFILEYKTVLVSVLGVLVFSLIGFFVYKKFALDSKNTKSSLDSINIIQDSLSSDVVFPPSPEIKHFKDCIKDGKITAPELTLLENDPEFVRLYNGIFERFDKGNYQRSLDNTKLAKTKAVELKYSPNTLNFLDEAEQYLSTKLEEQAKTKTKTITATVPKTTKTEEPRIEKTKNNKVSAHVKPKIEDKNKTSETKKSNSQVTD